MVGDEIPFVERPNPSARKQWGVRTRALLETETNGKAVEWLSSSVGKKTKAALAAKGLVAHVGKSGKGYAAWVERVAPTGGTG